jgi:hypothetical protein
MTGAPDAAADQMGDPTGQPDDGAGRMDDAVDPPYRVDYVVTADAFIDASRLAMAWMRNRILLISAGAAIAGLFLLVFVSTAPGLVLVFFALIMTTVTVTRAPERWVISRRGASVMGTRVSLLIGRAGIQITAPSVSGQIAWSAMSEVRADERAVIFVRDRTLMAWAPAAAFGSAGRRAEIVAFARERIAAAGGPA